MSTLTNRIGWLNQNQSLQVLPNAEEVSYKNYGAVKAIPLAPVQVNGGIIGYSEPLVTADGAPVSSTGPGAWGQLYRVGKY